MNRLACVVVVALLLGCAKEPDIPIGIPGGNPYSGGGGGGGGGSGGGAGGSSGQDSGVPDGGALQACSTTSIPSGCTLPEKCACPSPLDAGSPCYCYRGNLGDPCAAGSNDCLTPKICRWGSGLFWGKCGTSPGSVGDVCDFGPFSCVTGLSCTAGCAFGACCQ
jgi:hypothetical protein